MQTMGTYFRWQVWDKYEVIAKLSRWEDAVMVARANGSPMIKDTETGREYHPSTVVEYVCHE